MIYLGSKEIGGMSLTTVRNSFVEFTSLYGAKLTFGNDEYQLAKNETYHRFYGFPGTYTCIASKDGYAETSATLTIFDTDIYEIEIYPQYELPSEYQEVQYIKSTGSEYIDTGIPINSLSDVIIEAKFDTVTGDIDYFGGLTANNTILWNVSPPSNTYLRWGTTSGIAIKYEAGKSVTDVCSVGTKTVRMEGTAKSAVFYVNGEKIGTLEGKSFDDKTNIKLFKGRYNIPVTFYSFYLMNNDEELINLVSCYRKSDNVVGMYDLVSKTFFTNASGSGAFVAGPNIS